MSPKRGSVLRLGHSMLRVCNFDTSSGSRPARGTDASQHSSVSTAPGLSRSPATMPSQACSLRVSATGAWAMSSRGAWRIWKSRNFCVRPLMVTTSHSGVNVRRSVCRLCILASTAVEKLVDTDVGRMR